LHFIVLTDSSGKYKEGDVLDQVHARVAESKGTVVLPFRPEHARRNPVGGYFRRGFGTGIVPSSTSFDFVARGALFVTKVERQRVHCAFRLKHTGTAQFLRGEFRIAADTGTGQVNAGTLGVNTPVRLVEEVLGEPDADGGWTLKTSAPLTVAHEGLMTIGLYGAATGVSIEWVAFTQAD